MRCWHWRLQSEEGNLFGDEQLSRGEIHEKGTKRLLGLDDASFLDAGSKSAPANHVLMVVNELAELG